MDLRPEFKEEELQEKYRDVQVLTVNRKIGIFLSPVKFVCAALVAAMI